MKLYYALDKSRSILCLEGKPLVSNNEKIFKFLVDIYNEKIQRTDKTPFEIGEIRSVNVGGLSSEDMLTLFNLEGMKP